MAQASLPGSRPPARPQSRQAAQLPPRLTEELRHLEWRIRALSVLSGLSIAILATVAVVLVAFGLDYWFDLSTSSRWIALGTLTATGVGFGLFGLRRLLFRVPLPELAAAVEEKHPEFGERLLSLVEFSQTEVEERDKGSAMMRTLLERETLRLVTPADFTAVVDHSRASKRVLAACVAIGLLLLPSLMWKDSSRLLWARLLTPWNNFERPSNLFFEVPNGDRVAPRGEDIKLVAIAGWRNQKPEPIQEVRLNWAFEGAGIESRRMAWDEAANAYSTSLPAIQRGFGYSVSAPNAKSRQFQIRVEDRPAITSLNIELQPPSYTGLPAEQHSAAVQEILAFEHSHISLQLTLNKPVQHLELVWLDLESANRAAVGRAVQAADDSPEGLVLAPAAAPLVVPAHLTGKFPGWMIRAIEPGVMGADKTSATFAFQADRPGRFVLHAVDEFGLDNPKEPIRSIDLRFDQPPTIDFADANDQGTAKPDEIIEVPVFATDDVGIAAMELHIKTFPEGKVLKTIAVETDRLGTQELAEAFTISLAEFGLLPNDVISLRARAADERAVPGPNETWTPERLVRIQQDSLPYGFEAIASEREEWKNHLEQLKDEVIANRTEIQDMQKSVDQAQKENKPFDKDSQVPRLAQVQKEIADRSEQLAATFANHPLFEKLAPTLEQVAKDDVNPAADKTREVSQTPDLAAKGEALKQAASELNEAEAKLTQLQIAFEKQAALERDLFELQRLANRTEQLATDTEKYEDQRDAAETPEAERTPDSPKPLTPLEQQTKRDQLLHQHQNLSQDLNQLLNKRPELLTAAQEALLGRLQDLFDRAGELANREDHLSAALTEEAQKLAQQPSPQEPAQKAETPPQDESPKPEQPVEERPVTAPAEEKAATEAQTPPTQTPPTEQPGQSAPQVTEAVSKAVQEQQRIALAAKDLALTSEAQSGRESPSTKAAQQFADQAQAALQKLATGGVESAAESGENAAKNGKQAAQEFRRLPQSQGGANEGMAQSSEKLAERQAQLAERMSELGKTPAGRREVQQHAQQQLQQETEQLAKELSQVADSFGIQPLQQQDKAQEAQASESSAQLAKEAMQAAKQNLQQSKPQEAAQRASEAAKALRDAGKLAQSSDQPSQPAQPEAAQPEAGQPEPGKQEPAKPGAGQPSQPPPSPNMSPVPPEGALNVAQAAQQLNKIGEQLAKDQGRPRTGTPGQKPGEGKPDGAPGEQPAPGEGQPNPAGEPGQQPGEGKPGEEQREQQAQNESSPEGPDTSSPQSEGTPKASESLKQTAASMRKAMQQFGMPQGEPGKPGQPGSKSNANKQSETPNLSDFGNTDEARIVELENHLKGLTTRNWGELPGTLKTEILQASRKKPDGDYSQLIRRYFDEISRTQQPDLPGPKAPAVEGATP